MAAQPFELERRHRAPREPDISIGEFWLENPFDFEQMKGFNLSMYERNRLFMNRDGRTFEDVSHLSGVDLESDSRAVAVGDLDGDRRADLVVRSVGGGPLRVFLNRMKGTGALLVRLRGTRSNKDGIGARLVLKRGDRTLYREHFPQNTLYAQNANETIFGLGLYDGPLELTITWPSGEVQTVTDLAPGSVTISEP